MWDWNDKVRCPTTLYTFKTKLYVLHYWLCYNEMNGNEIPLKTWSCNLTDEQKSVQQTKWNKK